MTRTTAMAMGPEGSTRRSRGRGPGLRALLAGVMVGLSLVAPPASTAGAALPPTDWAVAINKAGRQRMLTQRMIKAYALIGLDVLPRQARAQLAAAVDRFETQLAEFATLELAPGPWREHVAVVRLWERFRPAVTGEVRREAVSALDELGEELLGAAHRFVLELEHHSGTEVDRLVNIAGRQRMLSQRLAKLYFLRSWGLNDPELRERADRAKAEFVAGLEQLLESPRNTPTILDELAAVNLQWTWFEYALGLQGASSYLLVVDHSSESILNSMDAVTSLYESLASP